MVQAEMGGVSAAARDAHSAAKKAFDTVPLGQGSRCVVNHWLSAWRDDSFPRLADFTDGFPRGLEHGLVVLEVWPRRSVVIRSAGALVQRALGTDLANRDWIEMTAEEDRPRRLAGISDVAEGCAARGIRVVQPKLGYALLVEEVMLPFRDRTAQGSRYVVSYHDSGATKMCRQGEGMVVNGERLAATILKIPLVGG